MQKFLRAFTILTGLLAFEASLQAKQNYEGSFAIGVAVLSDLASASIEQSGVNLDVERDIGFGAGATVEYGFADWMGVESGLHYIQRRYGLNSNNVRVIKQVPVIHVPLLLRFWLGEYMSFGAGTYFASSVGDVSTRLEVGNLGNIDFGLGEYSGIEVGVEGAVLGQIPVNDLFGVFAELRATRSLTNVSSESNVEEQVSDIMFLLGTRFEFQ